mgnify:CR=1 FL=1
MAKIVPPLKAMRREELDAATEAFGKGPEGFFVRGRHGVTHCTIDGEGPLVILSHGLGTSMHIYDEFVPLLTQAGFRCLRFDFFNHGFSLADDTFIKYTNEVAVDQMQDILDAIVGRDNPTIQSIIGHSTGGIFGILASLCQLHTHDCNEGQRL